MIAGLALAAAAAALLVLTVLTARRPADPVPDVAGYLERWAPLHGGYEPAPGSLAAAAGSASRTCSAGRWPLAACRRTC